MLSKLPFKKKINQPKTTDQGYMLFSSSFKRLNAIRDWLARGLRGQKAQDPFLPQLPACWKVCKSAWTSTGHFTHGKGSGEWDLHCAKGG